MNPDERAAAVKRLTFLVAAVLLWAAAVFYRLISMQVLFSLRRNDLDALPNAATLTDEMRGRVLSVTDSNAQASPSGNCSGFRPGKLSCSIQTVSLPVM